jgi:hypothetical protein
VGKTWTYKTRPEYYNGILRAIARLRQSYETKYSHLEFDWSPLDEVQTMHHAMELLVDDEEDVMATLKDHKKITRLWGAIERRDAFSTMIDTMIKQMGPDESLAGTEEAYMDMLSEGIDELSALFNRLYNFLHKHARENTLAVEKPPPKPIDRRAASDLSIKEFVEQYALKERAVIITGVNITEEEPWTLDVLKQRCGNTSIKLKKVDENHKGWGRLKHAEKLEFSEFVDTFATNATRKGYYLHDWSLSNYCPAAMGPAPYRDFTVPKYFTGDYFQRASFVNYQQSWPTLFIGSEETETKMHIDSGNSHFWLHLLSGRKEWRFYSREDYVNLYHGIKDDYFWFDPMKPDLEQFPLSEYAQMYHGFQEAGELVFIPAANPHAVRNLEPIHGISMNYADATNIGLYLQDAIGNNAFAVVEKFTDGHSVPHGLKSDMKDLRFGEWKSVQWNKLDYDLLTTF